MLNLGQSYNSGFSIEKTRLYGPGTTGTEGSDQAQIEAEVWLRDSDNWLQGMGFDVTLVGKFTESP